MRLVLRCDAAPALGVGHLGRSLAVHAAARDAGWEVALVGRFGTPWAHDRVREAGLTVLGPGDTPAEVAALAHDAGATAVHVDHYGLPGGDELLRACGARDVVVSNVADFGFGRRAADLTVNPNFGAPGPGSWRELTGPEYALLRPDVLRARDTRRAVDTRDPARAVVVMGGTDPFGATPHVVRAVADVARSPLVLEVLSPDAAALERELGSRRGAAELRFRPPTLDLAALLATSDVAFTAAGTTLLEVACIGVPTAALCVTDNQRAGYDAAVAAGIVVGLGDLDRPADWAAGAERLLTDAPARTEAARRGRSAVDGRGAARLVERITAVVSGGT